MQEVRSRRVNETLSEVVTAHIFGKPTGYVTSTTCLSTGSLHLRLWTPARPAHQLDASLRLVLVCGCWSFIDMLIVIRPSPLSRSKKPTIEYPITPYSFPSTFGIQSLSSPSGRCASPSTHFTFGFPFLSDGTEWTCGFLRVRFTFQVVGAVRM